MHFVVIGRDKDADTRARLRAAHLDYAAGRQEAIVYAGPLLVDGRMVGSLFVLTCRIAPRWRGTCRRTPISPAGCSGRLRYSKAVGWCPSAGLAS